jgi:hypothetical protein
VKNEIRTLIENSDGRRWTRSQLMVAVNRSDRYVRETIHALRREGCRIVTDTKDGGYWIARNDEEWRVFRRKENIYAIRRIIPSDKVYTRQLRMNYAN